MIIIIIDNQLVITSDHLKLWRSTRLHDEPTVSLGQCTRLVGFYLRSVLLTVKCVMLHAPIRKLKKVVHGTRRAYICWTDSVFGIAHSSMCQPCAKHSKLSIVKSPYSASAYCQPHPNYIEPHPVPTWKNSGELEQFAILVLVRFWKEDKNWNCKYAQKKKMELLHLIFDRRLFANFTVTKRIVPTKIRCVRRRASTDQDSAVIITILIAAREQCEKLQEIAVRKEALSELTNNTRMSRGLPFWKKLSWMGDIMEISIQFHNANCSRITKKVR